MFLKDVGSAFPVDSDSTASATAAAENSSIDQHPAPPTEAIFRKQNWEAIWFIVIKIPPAGDVGTIN